MRQAEDPIFAQMLSRIRLRQATHDDYKRLLNKELGSSCRRKRNTHINRPVCCRDLREAINILRLKQVSAKSGATLMYCVARIMERGPKILLDTIYSIKHNHKKNYEETVLSLMPNCSLMITQNLDQDISLVLGSFVKFYGFSNAFYSAPIRFTQPLEYMLVRILQGLRSDFVFSNDFP